MTLGDSLTHGFHNLSVGKTELAYSSLVARSLGCLADFRPQSFHEFGGHPLNLEVVLEAGHGPLFGRYPGSVLAAVWEATKILNYWRGQAGHELAKPVGPGSIPRNIAVYGWDLRDLLSRTADREAMFLQDTLVAISKGGPFWYTRYAEMCKRFAGLLLLDGARDQSGRALTPLQAAHALGEDGGIETLFVLIGANNVLGVLGDMQMRFSQEPGYRDLYLKERYNIWCPEHFCSEYQLVLDELTRISAQHVILSTVPHITVTPSAHGVRGTTSIGGKTYNTYYTHPWISDIEFDPLHDDKFSAEQTDQINAITDAYNAFIAESVELARREEHDWHLFDACKLLDDIASHATALPGRLDSIVPPIDTKYFETDSDGSRTQGGLFSLDGVHPTTVGYAVIAEAILKVMDEAGVKRSPAPSDPAFNAAGEIDFDYILANDTLMQRPPKSLKAAHGLVEELMDGWQMVQLLRGVL